LLLLYHNTLNKWGWIMKRSTWYGLFMFALFLKMLGASWDVSYHFKYLRELTELPHIVNSIGFTIAILLWILAWRTEKPQDKRGLKIVGLGYLVFFAAIPIDDWWHRTFGLDLTTWSPPHFSLYAGTVITILGMIIHTALDYERGQITLKMKRIYQLLLFVFLFEAFWFPLVQQEQGVLAYFSFLNGTTIASDEILTALKDPESQIYGGIPDWLYGVYGTFVIMMLFHLAKRFTVHAYSSSIMVAIYVSFRFVMDVIFANTEYQTSTVPFYLLAAGLVFDVLTNLMKKGSLAPLRVLLLAGLIVVITYATSWIPSEVPISPPLPVWSMAAAAATAVLGYLAAILLHGKVLRVKPPQEDEILVPHLRSLGQ